MKKAIPWQDFLLYSGIGIVSLLVAWLVTYLIMDYWKGHTVVVQGTCIGHHYVPSRTKRKTRIVHYWKTSHVEFYTVHYPEEFILTVTCPEGPKDFEVTHSKYTYYRVDDTVPVSRRIGYYFKRCVSSWIE